MPRPIFVAATRQHVGKTSVSLGLISGLRKRFGRVGFIKPVGQQHVTVKLEEGSIRVDKDVQLMKEYFKLDHLSYRDMSPVLVPRNYTKDYIDGQVESAAQESAINCGMAGVESTSDITVCEGTGHVGVGAIIGLSNAAVAKQIGADVILVANGGVGSAFDELEMNRIMLKDCGLKLRGVIVNKVKPNKLDMIRDYFGRAITERWDVPLLGVVPDLPFLAKATLSDLQKLLSAEFVSGQRFRDLHYGTDDMQCVTTAVRYFLRKTDFRQTVKRERRPLYVTHCSRDDVLLGYLAHYKRTRMDDQLSANTPLGDRWIGAMVLCRGDPEFTDPSSMHEDSTSLPYLMEIARGYDAPVMLAHMGTIEASSEISNFTAKMHIGDYERVDAAVSHYEPHIDFEALLNNL